MIQPMNGLKELCTYRELIAVLAWKNIAVRYKQAYLGIAWAVLKPVTLMLIFTLVKSFVGIDSGDIPYPILTFAALMPWTFFQESASEGVNSVVGNTALIKKIYFPREIFPLTSVVTKLVELGINFLILAGLMAWYGMMPSVQFLWVPVIIAYTVLASLAVAFAGAAINVYYRDVGQALPVLLSLLMYASPVIYPLQLVKDKLLIQQAAGDWSGLLYTLYTLNPLAGIIDAFQSVVLRGQAPDVGAMVPGAMLVAVLLPLSYLYFKRAESYFADVI
ncbi:ABC transporter permease [Aromatoleum evansii]|nr:ABC transporter permease [Aromatoleum evansii]